MYHVGKVLEVFSPKDKDLVSADSDSAVLLEMWDENVFTCSVAEKIVAKIKAGDVVFVDYRPISKTIAMPRLMVSKVLKGKKAERVWEKYTGFYHRRKAALSSSPQQSRAYG